VQPIEREAPRWKGDLESLFARCHACHTESGSAPELSRYPDLFDCREDGMPVRSLLLAALDRPDHEGAATKEERARLEAWLSGDLDYAGRNAHPAGWAVPGSKAFHGEALLAERYARVFDGSLPGACGRCHDKPESLSGAPACTSCHEKPFTPTSCGNCHGDHATGDPMPARSRCASAEGKASAALHLLHVGSSTAARASFPRIACDTCHLVPATVQSDDHVHENRRAEVRLPGYDPATKSCVTASCHLDRKPSWTTMVSGSAGCDACHQSPPKTPSHASTRACTVCHIESFAADGRLLASKHLDGTVEVGRACDSCHSTGPRPSVGGGPGAHAPHLTDGRFRERFACDACHVVPAAVDSPGHLDQPRPPVRFVGDSATARGSLSPVWDPSAGTCSNVGCHGAHLDQGMASTPPWSSTATIGFAAPNQIQCGGCHGLPPRLVRGGAGVHLATGPANCGVCHRDENGEPISSFTDSITESGKRAHINGCVDLDARFGMGCRR
jgi:predicted CxxxxCH...CXXCH cytochrome family protein